MRMLAVLCLALSSTVPLAACAVGGNPQPYGRGYAAFKDEYKSAPGADARPVGYDFDTQKNATIIAEMRGAAADLVSKLDQNTSFSADEIFLLRPHSSAFYNSFDYVLRDELTKRGYVIATRAEGATPLHFAASYAKSATHHDEERKPLHLILSLGGVAGEPASQVSGVYTLPIYDFVPAGGVFVMEEPKPTPTYSASAQRLIPEDLMQ